MLKPFNLWLTVSASLIKVSQLQRLEIFDGVFFGYIIMASLSMVSREWTDLLMMVIFWAILCSIFARRTDHRNNGPAACKKASFIYHLQQCGQQLMKPKLQCSNKRATHIHCTIVHFWMCDNVARCIVRCKRIGRYWTANSNLCHLIECVSTGLITLNIIQHYSQFNKDSYVCMNCFLKRFKLIRKPTVTVDSSINPQLFYQDRCNGLFRVKYLFGFCWQNPFQTEGK